MRPTTIKELDWLHDSDLLSIMYDTSGDDDWPIRLTIRCPDDMGYAPWDGKLLVVSAIGVTRSSHVVCGVRRGETFDHAYPGVSDALRKDAMKSSTVEADFNFEFTITLISGSKLEIICQDLQVEISE